jgi:hypothetical protein
MATLKETVSASNANLPVSTYKTKLNLDKEQIDEKPEGNAAII